MGKRRTQAEMEEIRQAIEDTLREHNPMTVRQVFYQMAVQDVVPKQENRGYSTVQRLLTEMRRSGRIPFNWIVDSSRTVRRAKTFNSAEDALRRTARTYRRDLWASTDTHVQMWLEKEALAGVLWEATEEWDVPLWVNRGYSSITYLHNGAEEINRAVDAGNTVYVYNFGDHDPSGVNAWEKLKEDLTEWVECPSQVRFERVAVTPEQIEKWNLPSKMPKDSDPRSEDFEGKGVQLDAIPPDELKALVEKCVTDHISERKLQKIRQIEQEEERTLRQFANQLSAGQNN
jgi:hypothetical protein